MSDKPLKWADIKPEPSPTKSETKWLQDSVSELVGEPRFSQEDLRKNIEEWNSFFAQKGLDNPKVRRVVDQIVAIIRKSVIQGSKKDRFYSNLYPTVCPDTPPLTTAKIMEEYEYQGHTFERFTGRYAVSLASPKDWPWCIENYATCNLKPEKSWSPHLLYYGDPANKGLEYMKMSVFQLAVGKIAIEIIDLFEEIYGKELPQKTEEPKE